MAYKKRPLYSLTLLTMLTMLLSGVATWLIFSRLWSVLPITIVALGLTLYHIRNLFLQNSKKVAFMFDAINNNDYNFKYATKGHSEEDVLVSDALNRTTQILFQAKAEAAQREKYYELIMNSVKTGIVVVDDDGYIYQCNKEALRLLGLARFTHVKQLIPIDAKLADTIGHIKVGEKQQISLSNERGTVNLSLHTSEMQLKEKHVRIIVLSDIHNEMESQEIDSWIRLTRVLTHEIMNAVTPITSLSDTLLSIDEEMTTDVRNGLEVISSTGKGLLSFVNSYRKFTHVPTPQPTLFYVEKFMERMIQLTQHQSSTTNIQFLTEITPYNLILYADENLISQVVLNLLKNAIQAIGPDQKDGWIKVRAHCDEEENVTIEISNNGPRINDEEAAHIFIPFFTTKENGSGIGLSISRQIMRVSGGSLTLKKPSSTPFTTFILTFHA